MDVFSRSIISLTVFLFAVAYSTDMLKFTGPNIVKKVEMSSYEKDLSEFKKTLITKEALASGYTKFKPKDPENIEPLMIWIHLQYIPYEISGDTILISYWNIGQGGYESLYRIINEK